MTDVAQAVELEFNEAQAYARLVEHAPAELLDRHGLVCKQMGGATVFLARELQDGLMFNRVIGLGLRTPANAEVLDAIDYEYLRAGVRAYAIEAAPGASPDGLGPLLRERGLMPFKATAMMVRDTAPPIDAATSFDVRQVDPVEAQMFGRVACTPFSLDEPYVSLVTASVGRKGWQHWAAFDNGTMVASAITAFTDEGQAWIGWVGTLPPFRGRGAQSALAAHQIRAAASLGVTRVSLEAAPGSRKKPSQTLANYRRLGWVQAYERPVYLRRIQA